MRKIISLAHRELQAQFFSPTAYVVGALTLLGMGLWFFAEIFIPGGEASLRPLFDGMAYIMIVSIPLLTMRLISEELHSGTAAVLLTAPVTATQVVLGKFFGMLAFYLILLATTGVYLVLMLIWGEPDAGIVAMGYVGMILLGAAFVAVGLFASTLTRYQLVAALVGSAILAVSCLLTEVLVVSAPAPVDMVAARLNAITYFRDFSRGVLDSRGLVFFLSVTALFLYLSVQTLESRRWR
ncbi:MAG: ABC transporter permease [Planctomycetota bacterium]